MSDTTTECTASRGTAQQWWMDDGELVPMAALPRHLPRRPDGRPMSTSAAWRVALRGVRGPAGERIALERVRVLGRWHTTTGAIRRWLAATATDR